MLPIALDPDVDDLRLDDNWRPHALADLQTIRVRIERDQQAPLGG
jgi:hypothetical protein